MARWTLVIDLKRCNGCQACAVACKAENMTTPGIKWDWVLDRERGTYPNSTREFIPMLCMHCKKPPCIEACPVDAITKSADNGIVLVDMEKCIGCKLCFPVCPFGAPQFGKDGLMQKCDFCVERVGKGLTPAWAQICPTGALQAGPLEELLKKARKRSAKRLPGTTEPSFLV